MNVKVTLPEGIRTAGSFTVNLKFDTALFEVIKVSKPPKVKCKDTFDESDTVSMVASNATESNKSGEIAANAAYVINTMEVAGVTVIDATLKQRHPALQHSALLYLKSPGLRAQPSIS